MKAVSRENRTGELQWEGWQGWTTRTNAVLQEHFSRKILSWSMNMAVILHTHAHTHSPHTQVCVHHPNERIFPSSISLQGRPTAPHAMTRSYFHSSLITGYSSSPCPQDHLLSITHGSTQTSHAHFLPIGNGIAAVNHFSQPNPFTITTAGSKGVHTYIINM